MTDEDPRSFWVAETSRPGEWLSVDLGGAREVQAVQVNFVDHHSDLYLNDENVYTTFRLEHSSDGKTWWPLADLRRSTRRDRPNAYVELPSPVRTRHIRYVHDHIGSPNLAISDLRVFGSDGGAPPITPQPVRVRRDTDTRNAFIEWDSVPGAVGYNILWGIASNKLYQAYQRFADAGTTLELRALSVGQEYWFAVEAFDESGVSDVSAAVHLP